jgi:cysteinyl-tRNA synthetase
LDLFEERNQARLDKDWGKADELRDALLDEGYVVQDSGERSELKPR